jgi:hypothetical protein
MYLTKQISSQLRGVYFGGNWTGSSMKDQLTGITWQQAITRVHNFNTIADLIYHTNYYINAVSKVLLNEPLDASDKYSFDHPPVGNQQDWEILLEKTWSDAEKFALLIEQLPENKLEEDFFKNKYGNYFRNILGVIEHTHYHLGQIVLIKKFIQADELKR